VNRLGIARSAADAPDIDGVVRLTAARRLRVGEFATVTVTRPATHDLTARLAPAPWFGQLPVFGAAYNLIILHLPGR
jgi:hypothetical protein